ncbi:MAG: helix-turn-helix domain-containing protein [Nitrososphaerales archaeon]
MYGISDRTLRRWTKLYKSEGPLVLQPKKTGPKHTKHSIPYSVEERILKLKQKHPS